MPTMLLKKMGITSRRIDQSCTLTVSEFTSSFQKGHTTQSAFFISKTKLCSCGTKPQYSGNHWYL